MECTDAGFFVVFFFLAKAVTFNNRNLYGFRSTGREAGNKNREESGGRVAQDHEMHHTSHEEAARHRKTHTHTHTRRSSSPHLRHAGEEGEEGGGSFHATFTPIQRYSHLKYRTRFESDPALSFTAETGVSMVTSRGERVLQAQRRRSRKGGRRTHTHTHTPLGGQRGFVKRAPMLDIIPPHPRHGYYGGTLFLSS